MEGRNTKKIIYAVLIAICLILIFFMGRTFNKEKGKDQLIFTKNGVQLFRKGLDVSGGTKLVYKISYDKYEEVYEGTELENIKRDIQNIILKNIDNRISALGVGDYKPYIENMDGSPYIVVEIGGIADLDQAKEIIGKTVELEFRLPSTAEVTDATIAARKEIANNLREDIVAASGNMNKLTEGKGSSNIFYTHLTGATLSQLPDIIKDSIDEIKLGTISDIKEGLYETVSYQDLSGAVKSEDYEGFTFFRVNDRQESSIDNANANDILTAIEKLGLEYETRNVTSSDIDVNSYKYVDGDLIYNVGEVAEGNRIYDVKIVQVTTESALLGDTGTDTESVSTTNQERIQNIVDTIKTSEEFDSEYATLLIDDLADADQVDTVIANFDNTKIGEVATYPGVGYTYVVYLRDVKGEKDHMYQELVINNVDKDQFEKALESQMLYDIEIVFVQDRETWTTAKTSKGDILNGAYFKYATVSQGQMGEPVVAINFDDQGKEVFCDITAENIQNQMAIFVGGVQLSAPVIQAKICGGTAQIDGSFTSESAKELVDNLNNGAMPASLILMQEDKVSPTLGEKALEGALIAALIGTLAIFVYITIMYGFKKGLITFCILLTFIIILSGFIKLFKYSLSLSGIAAVILSIGMAVDSNILIYERMKEELDKGRSTQSAIDTAYERSRSAIKDGNISTGLIALLLFILGSNMFKGFGYMLLVTILMTLFINVPLTKILLKAFYKNK